MRATTHPQETQTMTCPTCHNPKPILAVQGERQSQYACRVCGNVFEAEHEPREFHTAARPQGISLAAIAGCPAVLPEGVTHAN